MDNTNLQFPDHFFDAIYYDPPHVIRRIQDRKWMENFKNQRLRTGRTSPTFFERFGFWESKLDYFANIKGVNREFYRCLKTTGNLFCKISVESGHKTRCITFEEFLSLMFNFKVVKDKQTKSKSNMGKNIVHWLTMRPKP